MIPKTAYHPSGRTISFQESDHSYIDSEGVTYQSATQFISSFFRKFDTIETSNQLAYGQDKKYARRDPADIRAEWQAEGDRGRSEGTNVHAYAEAIMLRAIVKPEPISERCEKLFQQVDAAAANLLRRYHFVASEMIVFSPAIKKSGTIDLVMWDTHTQEVIIIDWKQNKNPLTEHNRFQKAYPPIDHLPDCDISKYGLQLSLYEYILKTENYFPDAAGYRRDIIHLKIDGYEQIPIGSFQYEIKEMLNHG